MSSSHPNQYSCSGTKPSWRHWKRKLKRLTAKTRRRLGKRMMEDAPPRATMGWVD